MTTSGGRPRDPEIEQKILESTLALIREQGYPRASMEAIADRAGVAKASVYLRWSHKNDLILDALYRYTEPSLEIPDGLDSYHALEFHIEQLTRILTDPLVADLLRGITAQAMHDDDLLTRLRERWIGRRRRIARELIQRAIADGTLRPDTDADLAIDELVAPLYFRLLYRCAPLDTPAAPQRMHQVFDGLRPAGTTNDDFPGMDQGEHTRNTFERTHMNIGFIGIGNIGSAVATQLAKAGHHILISNSRGPETLVDTATRIGGDTTAVTAAHAVADSDIAVIAIPLVHRAQLPELPFRFGQIVIDAMNYYPDRDGQIKDLDEHRTTTSEMTRALLPDVRLVKTFNSIYATDVVKLARPAGAADRSVLPLVGDDAEAKRVVAGLIDDIGYDPLDLGALEEGFRFQNGTPAYCVRGPESVLRPLLAKAQK